MTPSTEKMINYYKNIIKEKESTIENLKKDLHKAKLVIYGLRNGKCEESDINGIDYNSERINKPISSSYVNSFSVGKNSDPKFFIKKSIIKPSSNMTSFFRQPSSKKLNESGSNSIY